MNINRHVSHAENDLAAQLSRYLDAVLENEPTLPVPDPEIGDLAQIARALANTPRSAPDVLHQRMRERLRADPEWHTLAARTQITSVRSVTITASSNGHRHTRANLTARPVEIESTAVRSFPRIVPIIEVLALAAGLLIFVYFAFGRNQSADQPTPTVAPTPMTTQTPPPGAVGDWPMLGGGPNRSGSTDRSIPDAAPTVKWSVTLPAGSRAPVAAGDAVYVTNGGVLIALAADTGSERWRFDLGTAPSVNGANPPAVIAGVVYLATSSGTVLALDAATGEPNWTHDLAGAVTTSVSVAGPTLIAGTNAGMLYALDVATGNERWSVETGAITISSPVVADNKVYIATGSKIIALDLTSGDTLWQQTIQARLKSVAVSEGIAVVSASGTGSNPPLFALDATNGRQRWRDHNAGADVPPTIIGQSVYTLAFGNSVTSLDSARGTHRWSYSSTLKLVDFAVTAKGIVSCRSDGLLIALDPATGAERWRLPTGNAATSLAVGAGVIYVAYDDGTVSAYGTE